MIYYSEYFNMSKLYDLIDEEIHNFLFNLSNEYKLEIGELHVIWDLFITKEKEESKYNICKYTYTRGKKSNTICGSKILNSDNEYCSKHIKYIIPKKPKKNEENEEKKVIIKINKKINKYVHTETGFVFYSKEKLVVYARLINNELFRLSDEDLTICKLYRFKHDKKLYDLYDDN